MNEEQIRKIIGHKSYERLKKENLHKIEAIRKTPPAKIMSVAGIGPKKTRQLYSALGMPLKLKPLESAYRKVNNRTRLKNFLVRTKDEITKDPEDKIQSIEKTRKQLVYLHNFLAEAQNLKRDIEGKPEYKKLVYTPIGTGIIDPYALESEIKPSKDDIYTEIIIDYNDFEEEMVINSKTVDTKTLQEKSSSTNTIKQKGSVFIATEIKDIIVEEYNSHRKKTLTGKFLVIVDSELTTLYQSLKEHLSNKTHEITFILGKDEYYGYEAIWKYRGNLAFEDMVKKIDRITEYELYDEYTQKNKEPLKFTDWKIENKELLEEHEFWQKISQQQISHYRIRGTNLVFGIVNGLPKTRLLHSAHGKTINPADSMYLIETHEDYKILKETEPEILEGRIKIPKLILGIADEILGHYEIIEYDSTILFQSTNMSEIGMEYIKGG